jgi:hypothetical protein
MRSEKWTRFRVGSGILIKRGSGGRWLLSPNSQRQPRRRQLHKQIPEKVRQNPHLLQSNVRTQYVYEEGEAGVAEEGEGDVLVKAETNPFLLATLDYIIYWRFNHAVYRHVCYSSVLEARNVRAW